jgi:hypothetical protein
MALKSRLKSLDEVPEEARPLYVEQDGEFFLPVEGMVPKEKLDEFRNSNIELKKKNEELTTRFDGVDPDVFRELSAKAQKERDKKLIDAGKFDEMVGERVSAVKAGFEKERKGLEEDHRKLTVQLEGLLIDNAVRDAAAKSGVRSGAVDDVLLRARQVFKIIDGRAIAYEGDKQIFGATGNPITVTEYITEKLAPTAPHLFEASQGSGSKKAEGNSGGGASNVVARTDPKAFLANLDEIAGGKKQVT